METSYIQTPEAASYFLAYFLMRAIQADEFIEIFKESQLYRAYRTVPLLGDNNLNNVLLLGLFIVVIVTVQERNDIGILLDRTGFPQVGHHRTLVLPLLYAPAELGQGDNGNVQLPGNLLQRT